MDKVPTYFTEAEAMAAIPRYQYLANTARVR